MKPLTQTPGPELDSEAVTGKRVTPRVPGRVPQRVPQRVPSTPDEPATLVEVFEYVARVHPRPDTLNYKSEGRWVSISSDQLLARHGTSHGVSMRWQSHPAIASRFFPRVGLNGP